MRKCFKKNGTLVFNRANRVFNSCVDWVCVVHKNFTLSVKEAKKQNKTTYNKSKFTENSYVYL